MELVVGFLGLVIAIITLKLTFFSRPRKELENLKVQFKATQQLSIDIKNKLIKIATEQNCWDQILFNGITYDAYIKGLEHSQNTNLSNKQFEQLKTPPLTKHNIQSMLQSIEKQQSALLEIQSSLTLYFLNES